MLSQLITKLRREQYETEACHDPLEIARRQGWNSRAQSLIAELEQMQVEAREKEAPFPLEVEVAERTYERVAAYADEHGITAAEALERMVEVGRG